jgi:hypothetical protein
MRVTVKDEVIDRVLPFQTPTRTVEDLIETAVERVGDISPQHRCIVLNEELITWLERRLGSGALGSAADLIKAVDKLADIDLHKISFEFSPAQLQELKDRAAREGQVVEDYACRIVRTLMPMFFTTQLAQQQNPARKK